MSAHLQRAEVLLSQRRPDLAESHLRQALGEDPDSFKGHVLLSICLLARDEAEDAADAAKQAIARQPDHPMGYFALGRALADQSQLREAREAAEQAIQLDPHDPRFHGLLAQVFMQAQRYQECLNAAERGLAIDPTDTHCSNLRNVALSRLGRTTEAQEAIRATLARDPEDATTHANLGWSLLQSGEVKQSLEHFREALRLEPGDEWAQAGLVEALKARNPIYRWLLGFFLWMLRLDSRVRIGVIIGGYVIYRVLLEVARQNPSVSPYVWPVLIAYIGFAWLTWIGPSLFNSILRLNKFGRHALDKPQRRASNWLLGLMALALCFLVVWWFDGREAWMGGAILSMVMTLPATLVASKQQPMKDPARFWWAVALGVLAVLVIADDAMDLPIDGNTLFTLFLLGFVVFVMTASIMGARRPSV